MSSENRTVSEDFRIAAVDRVRFLLRTESISRWTAIITAARHLGIHPHSLRIWCDQNGLSAIDRTGSARKASDHLQEGLRRE